MKFYERVISDFGGYEKCKDILSQPNNGLVMNVQALRKHMLEYRRQHNIFEVGDKVVDTNYKNSDVQEIKSISGNRMNVFHKDKAYYFATFVFSFRHATDEEIKAGKRLEVK